MKSIEKLWHRAKQWRTLRLGRLAVFYRVGRAVRVTQPAYPRDTRNQARRRQAGYTLLTTSDSSNRAQDAASEVAVVVGVGPGFGIATARSLAAQGMRVVMVARRAHALEGAVREMAADGHIAYAYGCDATDERSVGQLMSWVTTTLGVPRLVIYSIQAFGPGRTVDVEVAAFEECWRQNCLGGFIVARAAARLMEPLGQGSIILVGSTSSTLGRADHLNLAVGKFGLRAISQVLSRELWSKGVHVAHLLIDADINESLAVDPAKPQADPLDIAEIVLGLHRQKRSAWSSEVDARPWNERFWEHC